MLGNFEYFYDLDGHFIFQEKKNYFNTSWNPIVSSDEGLTYVGISSTPITYTFSGNNYFTAFNNTPNLLNLRNDFCVWGVRKGTGGKDLPVHMRYAIDVKPLVYNSITVKDYELNEYNTKYGTQLEGQTSVTYTAIGDSSKGYYDAENNIIYIYADFLQDGSVSLPLDPIISIEVSHQSVNYVDWRELIYQMALDYCKYNHLDDFE